jgi:hypothetical protein
MIVRSPAFLTPASDSAGASGPCYPFSMANS